MLSREDLYSLEQYDQARPDFRQKVMQHKQHRRVSIGDHATLYFEDQLTMQYQVQEMLRIERIYAAAEIQDELDVYNALIPDGCNWKATFMMEYQDVEKRRQALAVLIGIENQTWIQVDGFDKVYAIANEDLSRSTEDKTSAVHFMRFEFSPEMVTAMQNDATITAGIDHAAYQASTAVVDATRASLVSDFNCQP